MYYNGLWIVDYQTIKLLMQIYNLDFKLIDFRQNVLNFVGIIPNKGLTILNSLTYTYHSSYITKLSGEN